MTIRDNKGYRRVLVSSYYISITGWGILLRYRPLIDKPILVKGLHVRIPIITPIKGKGVVNHVSELESSSTCIWPVQVGAFLSGIQIPKRPSNLGMDLGFK